MASYDYLSHVAGHKCIFGRNWVVFLVQVVTDLLNDKAGHLSCSNKGLDF